MSFAFVGLGIGICLLVWGWRGRTIDDHPVCRGCRYDLTTVYPDRPACPECGADTTVDGAVRFGNRRKRIAWLWTGVILILVSGAWLIQSAVGVDLTKYKPTWVLRFEARGTDDERAATKALGELLDRITTKRLSAAQITSLVEDALSVQADTTKPWLTQWGDVVVSAHQMGLVTPKHFARYGPPSGIPNVTVRPKVSQGKPVPFTLNSGGRGRQNKGGRQTVYAGFSFRSAEIDGKEISQDCITLSRSAWSYGGSLPRHVTEDAELSVGQHQLRLNFDFHLLDEPNNSVLGQWKRTVEVPFEVVEADVPTVRLVTDPVARKQLADQSTVEIRIGRTRRPQSMIQFPPIDFAIVADVWIKTDQHFEKAGEVRARPSPRRHGYGSSIPLGAVKGKVLEVILRPNVELAERTPFASEIWGEEIVIRDIQVLDDRPRTSGVPGP